MATPLRQIDAGRWLIVSVSLPIGIIDTLTKILYGKVTRKDIALTLANYGINKIFVLWELLVRIF